MKKSAAVVQTVAARQVLGLQRWEPRQVRLLVELVRSYELDQLIEQTRDSAPRCESDYLSGLCECGGQWLKCDHLLCGSSWPCQRASGCGLATSG